MIGIVQSLYIRFLDTLFAYNLKPQFCYIQHPLALGCNLILGLIAQAIVASEVCRNKCNCINLLLSTKIKLLLQILLSYLALLASLDLISSRKQANSSNLIHASLFLSASSDRFLNLERSIPCTIFHYIKVETVNNFKFVIHLHSFA